MRNITFDELKTSIDSIVSDVVVNGDIIRVEYGDPDMAFIVIEEPEYKIMREALEMLIKLPQTPK